MKESFDIRRSVIPSTDSTFHEDNDFAENDMSKFVTTRMQIIFLFVLCLEFILKQKCHFQ